MKVQFIIPVLFSLILNAQENLQIQKFQTFPSYSDTGYDQDLRSQFHFSSIKELHVSNSDAIQTQQQWFANDLLIFLKEGVGTVDLNITAQKVTVRNNYGWQTLKLSGTVGSLFVDLDGSSSLQAASLLATDSISFRSISPRACYISADQLLVKAQLYGAGNLYYHGQPSQILKTEYGTGRVLAH